MILPGFLDIIDIVLVALLMYGVYRLMRRSGAFSIFVGVLSILLLWVFVNYVVKLRMFGSILNKVVDFGVIAIIVLFQNEIRHFLVMIGSRRQWNGFVRLFTGGNDPQNANQYIVQLALACKNMALTKTGALIVLERKVPLEEYAVTGERMKSIISSRLVENIFFKNTPLHDGAVIVSGGCIEAAGCILPVSSSDRLPLQYGLRHRAAMGIAEQTDALAIVVSEETGHIALAFEGKIEGNLSPALLEQRLNTLMLGRDSRAGQTKRRRSRKAKTVKTADAATHQRDTSAGRQADTAENQPNQQ